MLVIVKTVCIGVGVSVATISVATISSYSSKIENLS